MQQRRIECRIALFITSLYLIIIASLFLFTVIPESCKWNFVVLASDSLKTSNLGYSELTVDISVRY